MFHVSFKELAHHALCLTLPHSNMHSFQTKHRNISKIECETRLQRLHSSKTQASTHTHKSFKKNMKITKSTHINSTYITLLISVSLLGLSSSACEYLNINLGQRSNTPLENTHEIQGSYDAETRYDMQTLTGTLVGSVESWTEPELAIKNAIVSNIKKNYGAQTSQAILSLYGDWIGQEIVGHIQDVSPAWVRALPNALTVVDAQLNMVDVQTSMLITKQTDGSYKTTQIWNGLSVFRDPECRAHGGLNCEQISISFKDLLDAEYPIEIVSSDFTAHEARRNQLEMQAHEIKFNYGRLALYIMTNLVLPDKPGAGLQLRDVLLAAINCRGLAGRLAGDNGVLGWNIGGVQVGISFNDLIGSCQEGVFGMIHGFVDQFHVPLSMTIKGQLELMDTDLDGRIDRLVTEQIDGALNALLIGGKTHNGPVHAKMTGWRVGDLPDTGQDLEQNNTNIDDGIPIFESNE